MVLERVSHPRLAAIALLGFGWWLIGLVLGLVGPPSLGLASSVTHLLGLATLVLCGVAYGVIWWSGFLASKLG